MYQVELKSAGSWDQFQKPSCTLNDSTIYYVSNLQTLPPHFLPGDITISLSRFLKKIEDGRGFFDHNAWPPSRVRAHSAGSGRIRSLCLPLTLREFHLFFPHRCSSFRFFNDTRNLMNKRLQIFRFDHRGIATERLQCFNLLTANLLWLFQAWCH